MLQVIEDLPNDIGSMELAEHGEVLYSIVVVVVVVVDS